MPIVGFALDGKDALAALDYDRLVGGGPPATEREWLGQSATFWPVARESPLVVGRTYDIVLASMLVADGALTGQHAHTGRHGKRWLAGAFVGVHGKRNSGLVDSWGAGQTVRYLARDAEFGAEQRPGAHDARRDVERAADSKCRLGVADGLQAHAV